MQTVQLTHRFKDTIQNIDELFVCRNECGHINTINSFCKRVDELSEKSEEPNIFKGDALEIFAEYLIKTQGTENRIGISDYQIVNSNEDFGVDGFGIGANKKPATVQVKYRKHDHVLKGNEDNLSNFLAHSWGKYKVDIEDENNMLIITTGVGVCYNTMDNIFLGKVRVLDRGKLQDMNDHMNDWWEGFWKSMKESKIKPIHNPSIKTLRDHQQECADEIDKKLIDDYNRGLVILPTGTGKTLIEAEAIRREINRLRNEGVTPLIKVNTSRILLCFQLLNEISEYLSSYGIEARFINFNSGRMGDKTYIENLKKYDLRYRPLESTTDIKIVNAVYEDCMNDKNYKNLPLIVVSTYQSSKNFNRLDEKYNVHLTIHDEAHNLVSEKYIDLLKLESERDVFFTATPRTTGSNGGVGMNIEFRQDVDEDFCDDVEDGEEIDLVNYKNFGGVIYKKSAKEMIEVGEMVKPGIHVVRARNPYKVKTHNVGEDYEALFESVVDAFKEHAKRIKRDSKEPESLGAKVLVVCRGQEDLIAKFETESFKNLEKNNKDVHIFALSSKFGIYYDGNSIKGVVTNDKKYKLVEAIKKLKPSDKALIFHVDMIGEGIDVPGITGVMPFRNCSDSKFIQNIGRAARLHPIDRQRYYAGEISPDNKREWIKPFSWVIIPSIFELSEDYESRFQDIVKHMRTEYDFDPEEILLDNVNGLGDEEEIEKVNEKTKRSRCMDSNLSEFRHEFENMWSMERQKYIALRNKREDEINSMLFPV